jgi:hypothetical protein
MSLFAEIPPLNPEKRGIGARTGLIWGGTLTHSLGR